MDPLGTVDGQNPVNSPVEVGSFSQDLQGCFFSQTVVVWDFWTINSRSKSSMGHVPMMIQDVFSEAKGEIARSQ